MSGVECNLIDQELKIKKKMRMLWTGKTIPRVSVKKYGISYLPYPGKNIKWDPADPTWDPRCAPGGIPPGTMEHPAWDPANWDPSLNS